MEQQRNKEVYDPEMYWELKLKGFPDALDVSIKGKREIKEYLQHLSGISRWVAVFLTVVEES